jgi:hypothetical protein
MINKMPPKDYSSGGIISRPYQPIPSKNGIDKSPSISYFKSIVLLVCSTLPAVITAK